jgi:hypothetical protein
MFPSSASPRLAGISNTFVLVPKTVWKNTAPRSRRLLKADWTVALCGSRLPGSGKVQCTSRATQGRTTSDALSGYSAESIRNCRGKSEPIQLRSTRSRHRREALWVGSGLCAAIERRPGQCIRGGRHLSYRPLSRKAHRADILFQLLK